MPNAKKYILTGVTLGCIAAVAAGLIAVTNLITAKKIAQNEIDAVNKGIASIFGDSEIKNEGKVSGHDYVTYYYQVDYKNSELEMHGYAFKCEGSNMYGKVSLIAGFDQKSNFMSLYLIKNEQTYASTLVDKYVVPLNDAESSKKDEALDDVSCGATYGAKLVREMINDAKAASSEFWSK